MKIIECVPNVSEGRDRAVLDAIADAVRAVNGVELLDVDPGQATHRTVFTFIGEPDAVADAAIELTRVALEAVDMRHHVGAHARQGAVDVIPFVPVGGGATMDDCIALARSVGKRIAERFALPIYLYEHAATTKERASLAAVRKGEYEGLETKLRDAQWAPDFGPATFVAKAGATAVGARPFLIAYNVDLNTTDRKLAHDIALDLREQGRLARGSDGKILRAEDGSKTRRPGKHRSLRAVGWFIPEFGRAQVSMNLTDFHVTPPHVAFDSVREEARARGLRVTGSEIVGLIPLEAILMAGRHYLERQGKTPAVPEPDLVDAARASLGLDDVKPFDPEEAIIDYRLAKREHALRGRSLVAFTDELSRDTPAPGGGSVAALVGAQGAALTAMVAALTAPRLKDDQRAEMVSLGSRAHALKDRLMRAVDDDSAAFDSIRGASRLPRKTDSQIAARATALEAATRRAIDVPLAVLSSAVEIAELAVDVARLGIDAAASDAGVAAHCARTAAHAAALNVRINLPSLADAEARASIASRTAAAIERIESVATDALEIVHAKLETND